MPKVKVTKKKCKCGRYYYDNEVGCGWCAMDRIMNLQMQSDKGVNA